MDESLSSYRMTSQRADDDFEIIYNATGNSNEISQITFKKSEESDFLEVIVRSDNQIALEIDLENLLSEEDIYGLGGIYNGTWLVRVDDQGTENLTSLSEIKIDSGSWFGARTRFWSFLISSPNQKLSINEINTLSSKLVISSMSLD